MNEVYSGIFYKLRKNLRSFEFRLKPNEHFNITKEEDGVPMKTLGWIKNEFCCVADRLRQPVSLYIIFMLMLFAVKPEFSQAGGAPFDKASEVSHSLFDNCANYVQQQKLMAVDGGNLGQFGNAVAINGNTMVVGRPSDTIGGNNFQGSAYIFVRSAGTWSLQQKLLQPDGAANDGFGSSVAISGDTVLIGAGGDDVAPNNNQGSAYVFVRNGTVWSLQQKLLATDGSFADGFGNSVAIAGDTAVISAIGDQPQSLSGQGSAYIFVRSGTNWSQQQKLVASDGDGGDGFGHRVSIDGETVLIAALLDDVGSNIDQGSAYVFVRSGTTWSEQQKLTAADGTGAEYFATSIALNGDTVVAGIPSDTIGVNQTQGSAYVFVRSGTTWSQQQKLTAADGESADSFGNTVAVSGDSIIVGVSGDNIASSVLQGSVYTFGRSGTVWSEIQQVTTPDGLQLSSLAFDGGTIVAGKGGDFTAQGFVYAFICSTCAPITLAPSTLPNATIGVPYSQALTATGGSAPYTFTISNGALPPGLSLSTAGLLSGTATGQGFLFTVQATDSNGCSGALTYSLNVVPPCGSINIMPATLPDGFLETEYHEAFSVTGGTTPYSVTLESGSLPPGLSIVSGGVSLIGFPSALGTFNFVVRATDVNGCTGTKAYTLLIREPCPNIFISPNTLLPGTVGSPYSQAFTQTGGVGPITWSISAPGLPPTLSLDPTTGILSGTPTGSAVYGFNIRATDANGCFADFSYTLIINSQGLMFYPLSHPVRLLDTRFGQVGCDAPSAPINGLVPRTQIAAGRTCDGIAIPAAASVVTGNITTVESGGGFLTLYPSDSEQPLVANSNYGPNEVLNNVFTVGLGSADGGFKIVTTSTTHVVIDITGYYAPPGTGGLYFHSLTKPIRLLETRSSFTGCFTSAAPLQANVDTAQQAHVVCDGVTIPNTAQAIVGNATTVNPSGPGFPYLTLFPADAARPLVASSNYLPGQVMNAPFTVGLSATGEFKIYPTTTTDIVIDILGYYSAEANDANGAGLLFYPLPRPVRLLETRAGFSGCYAPGVPFIAGSTRLQPARGICNGLTIANTALAIVGNATVVNSNGGYLTFWPSSAVQPTIATSNFLPGQIFNRHFTVGLGSADGAFKIFPQFTTDLVIDVSGFFAP